MEFRKIQFTGRSSYIISLPKKWVTEHNLKQGDVVPLAINPDGSITIFPKEPREVSERKILKISREYSPDMAVRLVISAYIQGYDVLEIHLAEEMPIYKVKIRKVLQSLPGVEIILDEPQRMVAKSLLDEEEVNLAELLNRIRSLIISMLGDLEMLIAAPGEEEILRDINDLENELDRFYFLIIRAVNRLLTKRGVTEESGIIRRTFDLLGILFIVRNIERIGDHITRIAENPSEINVPYLKEKFSQMMAQIEERDLGKIDRLMLELKEEIRSIDYRSSIALESYRRILEYLENIGETIINMALS
ncbi:transcription regulator [Thermococcus onnurineus NA1]|uniref:Transcription regulator n=1 Tax=Thermococcus onnurineus (strain NA1) TaxID=523850 RepID=B6YXS0_THEON|nr:MULTISPECIES: phosphate uptake regulator PhoU [Thermococcus]ACJ16883.1 transcription regulator [Thermococcus onnurineus NA1]NJE43339.1 phosphate uptake regulator PhoU [Thermococcus sp. GR6]NJE46779.1 phosphate uptake regulator PhoU [Thermococcus sp. GR7]NJE77793.1 phosphate uptake regulator PhoU [Thermococcus sp. GR4]NJF22921.1 phosphate uptake regulator PhoU [Thermococcus sp. GR5]